MHPKEDKKILVYRKYIIPKFLGYQEIQLLKIITHPFHSLKMIFENSTKIEMTDPSCYLCQPKRCRDNKKLRKLTIIEETI